MRRLAYVVSSHGFGHAARSCAVIDALWRRHPGLVVDVFAGAPLWFFEQSLGPPSDLHPYEVHAANTDVGLVQTSALREDMAATRRAVEARLPFAQGCAELARAIDARNADAVVCDVSPWGLAAARRLGLPAMLVENFTWDWIYEGYPDLASLAPEFEAAFDVADLRIQTEPVCRPLAGSILTPPVRRPPRAAPEATRALLGLRPDDALIVVTMGGIQWRYERLDALQDDDSGDLFWVIAGAATGAEIERRGRLVLLPHRSPVYHPDLMQAADVVVSKLGYSTVAEAAGSGARFVYVARPDFRESPRLEAWVQEHLAAEGIEAEDMEGPDWVDTVGVAARRLLERPRAEPKDNGADRVADAVLSI